MPVQYVKGRVTHKCFNTLNLHPYSEDFMPELDARWLNQRSNGILKLMPLPRHHATYMETLAFAESQEEWATDNNVTERKIQLNQVQHYTMPYAYICVKLHTTLNIMKNYPTYSPTSEHKAIHALINANVVLRYAPEIVARRLSEATRGVLHMLPIALPLNQYTYKTLDKLCLENPRFARCH